MIFIQKKYRTLVITLILMAPINLWGATSVVSEYHPEVIKLLQYFKNPSKATSFNSFNIWKDILKRLVVKKRRGLLIRGVPKNKAISLFTHSQRVGKALTIYGKHFDIEMEKEEIKATFHDTQESIVTDYIFGSDEIAPEAKYQEEKEAWISIIKETGPEFQILFDYWLELEERKTLGSIIIDELDKMDFVISTIPYLFSGYEKMNDVYPYARGYFTNTTLLDIMETLLEREFTHISVQEQYYLLLRLNGDMKRFQSEMRNSL